MPGVEGTLSLANSAEAAPNGLIHALGLGWDQTSTPTPPMAIVLMLRVPWDLTNKPLPIEIKLIDEDGYEPLLGQDPAGNPAPIMIQTELEVGRPAGVKPGSSLPVNQVLNLGPGLPLVPKRYEWKLTVSGEHIASHTFVAVPAPYPPQ